MYVRMYICLYVRMYVCMYVCIYACMHACMCMHAGVSMYIARDEFKDYLNNGFDVESVYYI